MPRDSFGREIDYLRISVIDACNLRCTYCMPLQGARFLPKDDLLTAEEFGQVVDAAVSIGFRKFRLTGGEPTLRRDLEDIIRRIKSVEGAGELSMTTNGILLPDLAADLAAAGLDRINLHLDTLDEQRLHQIMRRHDLAKAWDGIRAAEDAGLAPIKMNTVVVAGENEHDVVELAKLTLEHDWHIRFIELMPLGSGPESTYSRDKY
ncbi:MAG: radical SAM protein, partial [Planctomycetota bacterium]